MTVAGPASKRYVDDAVKVNAYLFTAEIYMLYVL
jgi:hypothetical protein